MKILFLQMKRYSEFARLCFRSERVFVMGGDPTKNCNFHRGKVGLLWSKNLNLVCRENCFANRDCSPNLPFPLHLMKCQPQCSAANSYFVPQQSMSTVTRQRYTFLCAAKTALQTRLLTQPSLSFASFGTSGLNYFKIFHQNLHIFQLFWLKFVVFLTDFDENFTGFHEIFRNHLQKFIEIANFG